MKKILLSIVTIALVVSSAVWGTRAYFFDTKSITGNTFSTGTIAISVGDTQTTPVHMADMKPGYTDYVKFTVNNDGTNPVNLLKKLTVTADTADLASVIDYDMEVWLYDGLNGTGTMRWHTMQYDKDAVPPTALSGVVGTDMFLGMIPEGWSMKVSQSYHMKTTADNDYQGKTMSFDITLTGEQLKGTLVLRPKSGDPKWLITYSDVMGTLTYGVKDSKFNFSFTGKAPLGTTGYSLVAYHEAWSTPSGSGWGRPVTILGSTISLADGTVNIPATSVELSTSLLKIPVWLVKTDDLTGSTLNGWTPSAYLFDTGLIDYYDTGL